MISLVVLNLNTLHNTVDGDLTTNSYHNIKTSSITSGKIGDSRITSNKRW